MMLHHTLPPNVDHSTPVANCVTGEVRLQDGPNVREGRVEVCINNAWGTVCNDQFGIKDAIVTCTQMKFSNEGNFMCTTPCQLLFTTNTFLSSIGAKVVRGRLLPGSAVTPIFLRGVQCDSDTHSNILDCEAVDLGITSCSHEDDVVVHCEGNFT